MPTINQKPLDLWLLRKEVHKLGGYFEVSRNRLWSDIGRALGYGGVAGLSTQIKNSYSRIILAYEQYCDRVKQSNLLSAPLNPHLKTHTNIQTTPKRKPETPKRIVPKLEEDATDHLMRSASPLSDLSNWEDDNEEQSESPRRARTSSRAVPVTRKSLSQFINSSTSKVSCSEQDGKRFGFTAIT